MTITIQHYTGHTVKVDDLSIHCSGEAFAATATIEGLVYTSYFARKVGKKDAAKALASQYVERQQRLAARLAAEAVDPREFL